MTVLDISLLSKYLLQFRWKSWFKLTLTWSVLSCSDWIYCVQSWNTLMLPASQCTQYTMPSESYECWLTENFTNETNIIGSIEILPRNYELTCPTNFSRTSNADFGEVNKIITLCSYLDSTLVLSRILLMRLWKLSAKKLNSWAFYLINGVQ